MKLRRSVIVGVGASMLALPTTCFALFGTGDVVFDPSSYGELVSQYGQQLKQVASEAATDLNTARTYANLVENGLHLTSLPQIASDLGLSTSGLSGEMSGFQALSSLYQTYASGQQLVTQGEQMLNGRGFTLPQFSLSQLSSIARQFYSGSDATQVQNGYNQQILATQGYMQQAGSLVDLNNQRQSLATSLNDQIALDGILGDNSAAATAQEELAATQTIARQQDVGPQLQQVTAAAALQGELVQVNAATAIAEADLRDTQARQQFASAPISDVTAYGLTAN